MENIPDEKLHQLINAATAELSKRRRSVEYEGYTNWLYDSHDQYLTTRDAWTEYNSDTNRGGYNLPLHTFSKRFKQDFRGVTTRTPEGRRTVYKKVNKNY